ncbi:hypothetical protein HALDL1_11735 [Halobacterium sp. DL1]|nr:hypothetical protein HALDL1_11735 [Halobacterium sp. DL1]
MNVVEAAYTGMSALLVLSAAVLIYPAARGFQVLVYRRAVLYLGTSVVLFVGGWVGADLLYFGLVGSRAPYVVSFVVLTAAAALHFVAVWLFVRDFVDIEPGSISIETSDVEGGFADDAE